MNSQSDMIVVVGSCIIDLTYYVMRLPLPGESFEADDLKMGFGGKGANQCVMASKLGVKTALIAKLGNDSFGRDYWENLKKTNIDTELVTTMDKTNTGVAVIAVDREGQNSIIVSFGASMHLRESDVIAADEKLRKCKVLLCQWETPIDVSVVAMKTARQYGAKTIFNAAPAKKGVLLPDELFKYCDVFCVNESEAACITESTVETTDDFKRAAKTLLNKGCNSVVITTGASGAVVASGDDVSEVAAMKVDAVDTTGAGDAFLGSLAYYMFTMPQLPLLEMVRRSCDIASISVTKPGTQSSYCDKSELPDYLFQ